MTPIQNRSEATDLKRSKRNPIVLVTVAFLGCAAVLNAGATSQTSRHNLPPLALHFHCPSYTLPGSTPLSLQADLFGPQDPETIKGLTFSWQLSEAKIVSGQGTRKVLIDPSNLPVDRISNINLDLTVEGGPPEMISRQSCVLKIDRRCSEPHLLDSYSVVSLEEERQHLDRLAKLLLEAPPQSVIYILSYAGKTACIYEGEWRATAARKHLVERKDIPINRVVAIDAGFRQDWTVDVFISDGRCGPIPNPTMPHINVRVAGQCYDVEKTSPQK